MTHRLLSSIILISLLAGCAAQPNKLEPTVVIGDPAGLVKTVSVRHKDLKSVCSFEKFQEGFRYTYMSMWNGRIDKILESKPRSDIATYYKSKFFYSKPNTKAILDANPRDRDQYSACQESSYQQGKINGFLYSLEDLKGLEENEPK